MTLCPRCKIHYKCSEQCRKWNEYKKTDETSCICPKCTKPRHRASDEFLAKCEVELGEKVVFT